MIDRIVNTKKTAEAEIVLLSTPYEGSVSFLAGTAKAPKKILKCLDNNLELFDRNLLCEPSKKLKTASVQVKGIKRLKAEKAIRKIQTQYEKLLEEKKFVILLGGEHTVSLGALEAISKKENPKEITIFQIDAHQDLRDNNSDYNKEIDKYAHSCVMRRAHELGYNLVQVGIRTFSKYEYEYWQKNQDTITVFEWNEKKLAVPDIAEIIKSIKTQKIYLSIDVDGFDPSFMPGTGTPVQGGIDWRYGLNLVEELIKEKELLGADIVEVAPMKDSVLTEWGAAKLCYTIMANKFKGKLIS